VATRTSCGRELHPFTESVEPAHECGGIPGRIVEALSARNLISLVLAKVLLAGIGVGHVVAEAGSHPGDLSASFGGNGDGFLQRTCASGWTAGADVTATALAVFAQRPGGLPSGTRAEPRNPEPGVDRAAPPPVLPGVNADPHIAVFGDTFYIYPTTDGSEGWRSTSFRAWSSRDLVRWTNEGVILDLPRDLTWASLHAWAPAIASKDGRYYYYYSAAQNVGVAVADTPVGPFRDPLGKPLVARADFPGMQAIDPMVFVDDDRCAYLYWGQGRCKAVRLNDDMISFEMDAVVDLTPPGYNEGPFVHKREGRYYLTWSEHDTRDPRYSVAYATGDSPLGPFAKAPDNPILRQSGPVKGAGHHSIVQIPGRDEWVIAYHRFRIPDGNGYNRETCLSPLRHAADGALLSVDVFESVSLQGTAAVPGPTP
jgi:GH43 family beta-xylosidase